MTTYLPSSSVSRRGMVDIRAAEGPVHPATIGADVVEALAASDYADDPALVTLIREARYALDAETVEQVDDPDKPQTRQVWALGFGDRVMVAGERCVITGGPEPDGDSYRIVATVQPEDARVWPPPEFIEQTFGGDVRLELWNR